jgi:hypothetical protein
VRAALLISLLLASAGCATPPYSQTPAGRFSGALDVRWVASDYFLLLPNEAEPLTFVRSDGRAIRPGRMFTDGGSIPRFLWGVEGFSPWGYAPAYIVHDWLFEAHQCDTAPDNQYSFADSVAVMAESLKTVMEASPEVRNTFVFDSVVAAIASPIAKRLWDQGSCKAPPPGIRQAPGLAPPGELLMTIRFQ